MTNLQKDNNHVTVNKIIRILSHMIKQQFFCKFTFHLFYITRSYLNKQHQ